VKNNKKAEWKRCSKYEFLLQIFGVQIVEDLSLPKHKSENGVGPGSKKKRVVMPQQIKAFIGKLKHSLAN